LTKRINLPSRQSRALQALVKNESGAEWRILEELTHATASGVALEPEFQTVANSITAKIFLLEKLPQRKRGRPKDPSGNNGWVIANRYYFLKDAGATYEDSVAKVALEFCKDERHIMRLVKENKSEIGSNAKARSKTRDWWAMCSETQRKADAEGKPTYLDQLRQALTAEKDRDLIREIEDVMQGALSAYLAAN
jgi:hypothetical protein